MFQQTLTFYELPATVRNTVTCLCGPDDVVFAKKGIFGFIVQITNIHIDLAVLGKIIHSDLVRIVTDQNTKNINLEFIQRGETDSDLVKLKK